MSLNILHVCQPTTGGVAKHVLELAAVQREWGAVPVVASPSRGPLSTQLASLDLGWIEWDARRTPGTSTVAETRRLRQHIKVLKPDVVHLHSSKAGLAGRLGIEGQPVIFTPHAFSIHAVPKLIGPLVVGWERFAARRTARLVCVSDTERQFAVSKGIQARVSVIPNAVDVSLVRPLRGASREAARHRLGVAPGPSVVCVGRLARQKGQDLLLDAWPTIRRMSRSPWNFAAAVPV